MFACAGTGQTNSIFQKLDGGEPQLQEGPGDSEHLSVPSHMPTPILHHSSCTGSHSQHGWAEGTIHKGSGVGKKSQGGTVLLKPSDAHGAIFPAQNLQGEKKKKKKSTIKDNEMRGPCGHRAMQSPNTQQIVLHPVEGAHPGQLSRLLVFQNLRGSWWKPAHSLHLLAPTGQTPFISVGPAPSARSGAP